jgi:hypothetical protein
MEIYPQKHPIFLFHSLPCQKVGLPSVAFSASVALAKETAREGLPRRSFRAKAGLPSAALAKEGAFVPTGHLVIARRFNAGISAPFFRVPKGRLKSSLSDKIQTITGQKMSIIPLLGFTLPLVMAWRAEVKRRRLTPAQAVGVFRCIQAHASARKRNTA